MLFYPKYERQLLTFVNPIDYAVCVTNIGRIYSFQRPTLCSEKIKISKNKNPKSFYLNKKKENIDAAGKLLKNAVTYFFLLF